MRYLSLLLVVIAVAAVAFADVFIKKASTLGSFSTVMKSPWIIAAILMYILQVVIFTYIFVMGTKLISVGMIQTGLYAVIVVVAGLIFFHEQVTFIELMGIILVLTGVMLLQS